MDLRDKRVFVDASFWIAYREPEKPLHIPAKRALAGLFAERVHLVTTLFVFAEIHAHFSKHPKRRQVVIQDFWNNPILKFEEPSSADKEIVMEILRQHGDKNYSFCDVVSFVVMERLGVQRVLSFDDHFRQYGRFEVIG